MKATIITTLLVVCALGLVCCLYMLLRNAWVYRSRRRLIGTPEYHMLPSYNEMLKRFWCWRIDSFLKDKTKQ